MEKAVKVTKTMVLAAIEKYFTENADFADGIVTAEDVVNYASKEQAALANKAAKAKAKAAEKKAEGDDLRDAVEAVLTDEYEPIADVAARVEGEDVTVAKVTYRLSALVKAGIAEKTEIKVSDGEGTKSRKIMGYRLAAVADAVDTDVEVDAE
jgi:hypothetical protein